MTIALAAPDEDLALAASKDATEAVRMEAFERLVALGSTDMELVTQVSQDDQADARLRWVSIRALGQIKGDRSRNILIELVTSTQVLSDCCRTQSWRLLEEFADAWSPA